LVPWHEVAFLFRWWLAMVEKRSVDIPAPPFLDVLGQLFPGLRIGHHESRQHLLAFLVQCLAGGVSIYALGNEYSLIGGESGTRQASAR
jgi:hypothetical protein